MQEEKKTVSQEKVWMKHYAPEVRNADIPRMKIYSLLKEYNQTRLQDVAMYYYGTKITIKKLIQRIDECADAFAAIGVKQGDTVSMLSASTPESIIALYALNKIGATLNAIDPRLDKKGIARMIKGSGSKILLVIEMAYPKVAAIFSEIKQDHIIVQSAATSLPLLKKIALKLVTKSQVPYGKGGVIHWDTFIAGAKNGMAIEAPYVGDATVFVFAIYKYVVHRTIRVCGLK